MAVVVLAGAMALGGCGGGEDDPEPDIVDSAAAVEAAESAGASATDAAAEAGGADAPGEISLTIGDETWDFGGALCAYTGAPAGEDGSEWNVSFVQDDLQVYISVDGYGPLVSVTNIVDYGTLGWEATGDAVELTVSGNDISGTGTFSDQFGSEDEMEGSVTATCASWVEG